MTQIQEYQTRSLLNDLFYSLAGFDTSLIYLEGENADLIVNSSLAPLVVPFKFLIIKIREFYNDPRFKPFVFSYLKKINVLKKKSLAIEELLICLQEDFEVFSDLDRFARGIEIDKNSAVYKHFNNEEQNNLNKSVNDWINLGIPGSLISINPIDGFTSCFWKDCCKIHEIGLSKEEMEGIEECGKIVFFIRVFAGVEIVDDESYSDSMSIKELMKRKHPPKSPYKKFECSGKAQDQNLGNPVHSDFKETLSSIEREASLKGSYEATSHNIFEKAISGIQLDPMPKIDDDMKLNDGNFRINLQDKNNGLLYKDSDDKFMHLLQPFYYDGDISEHRKECKAILNKLVSNKINQEISAIHSIAFFQDLNIFLNIFERFSSDFFSSVNVSKKLNDYFKDNCFIPVRFISFEFNNVDLGEYVLKLLKYQRIPASNSYLLNLQRISISFEDGILKYFLSNKSFVELNIIFRFLFSLNSVIYYLERSKSYNFTRVIYLIFLRLKMNEIPCLKMCDSVDSLIEDFNAQISFLLNSFYLTNSAIFVYLSRLIDVAYEYLQMDFKESVNVQEYNKRVGDAVNGLMTEILNSFGDNDFSEFLKNLDVITSLK